MKWTTERPTVSGQYRIRPLGNEKMRVGSDEIIGERLVTIAYIKGMRARGLCIFLEFSAIDVAGCGLEFYGPLEPPA